MRQAFQAEDVLIQRLGLVSTTSETTEELKEADTLGICIGLAKKFVWVFQAVTGTHE